MMSHCHQSLFLQEGLQLVHHQALLATRRDLSPMSINCMLQGLGLNIVVTHPSSHRFYASLNTSGNGYLNSIYFVLQH